MTTWLLLNSIGLAAVSAVLYLVLRQIGYILRRVTPVGARASSDGPRIRENVAHHFPEIIQGRLRDKTMLIVFLSKECSICSAIRAGAEELARTWRRDAHILLVYDCHEANCDRPSVQISRALGEMRSSTLRQTLGVSFVPFAVVTDPAGTVLGKGLVNEIGHLESLLELEKVNIERPVRLDEKVEVSIG